MMTKRLNIEKIGDREFIVTRGKKKIAYMGYTRETVLKKERAMRTTKSTTR